MKTTLELPDVLVRELERRAHQAGQELAQAVTEVLWKGLAASPATNEPHSEAVIKSHVTTGLPYIECSQTALSEAEMTPERVADVLLEQEVAWQHEAGR